MSERCIQLADAAKCTLMQRVEADYPEESCGVLLGHMHDRRLIVCDAVPARNAAPQGRQYRFELEAEAVLAASRRARAAGLDIVGFYHSHPDDAAQPSQTDLHESNPWSGYCYLIASVMNARFKTLKAWRRADTIWVEDTLEES